MKTALQEVLWSSQLRKLRLVPQLHKASKRSSCPSNVIIITTTQTIPLILFHSKHEPRPRSKFFAISNSLNHAFTTPFFLIASIGNQGSCRHTPHSSTSARWVMARSWGLPTVVLGWISSSLYCPAQAPTPDNRAQTLILPTSLALGL